ncbi:SET domain group 37 [Artemisia annua]|uniref:SET domain group 37 n=1 Tax=Artemisia annua TaxID=35608 RepID=A0A2U1L1Q4_ARTAN|nr:SET domain group 37 [Artemisia annua]
MSMGFAGKENKIYLWSSNNNLENSNCSKLGTISGIDHHSIRCPVCDDDIGTELHLFIKCTVAKNTCLELACNAHTVCDSELIPLGTCLYPVISLSITGDFMECCSPNAVLVYEGRIATVRVVQHLSKGSEVLISYVETAGSTMTRQKALREQYFFTCSCTRCIKLGQPEDIEESAVLEDYRCKNRTCDGFLLRDPGITHLFNILNINMNCSTTHITQNPNNATFPRKRHNAKTQQKLSHFRCSNYLFPCFHWRAKKGWPFSGSSPRLTSKRCFSHTFYLS